MNTLRRSYFFGTFEILVTYIVTNINFNIKLYLGMWYSFWCKFTLFYNHYHHLSTEHFPVLKIYTY